MTDKTTQAGWGGWRLPSYAAIVELVIFIPLAICNPDIFLFISLFVAGPTLIVVSLILIVWLIRDAIVNRHQQLLPILATLMILWAIPMSVFFYDSKRPFELRETARWLAWSREYKSEVLAQPTSTKELKHIQWDASGFAGFANNTVYLVFDPSDTLSTAAKSRQPGKFDGLPCAVWHVRRLESQWYAVLFYTDQYWGQGNCN